MRVLLVALCLQLLFLTANAATFGDKAAHVVRIHDGDTLIVSIPDWPSIVGQNMPVRVFGVDTPEINGQCDQEKSAAQKAKAFSHMFADKHQVMLRNIRRDKYFRLLADIDVDGKSLAVALIKAGLAYPYFGGTKINPWCANGK
jgi:micrococcal nuclease